MRGRARSPLSTPPSPGRARASSTTTESYGEEPSNRRADVDREHRGIVVGLRAGQELRHDPRAPAIGRTRNRRLAQPLEADFDVLTAPFHDAVGEEVDRRTLGDRH